MKNGENYVPFAQSISALSIMHERANSPRKKLNCIFYWHSTAVESLNYFLKTAEKSPQNRGVGQDLLLPVLEFSLLRAGTSGLGANSAQLLFMEEFMDTSLSEIVVIGTDLHAFTWANFNNIIDTCCKLDVLIDKVEIK